MGHSFFPVILSGGLGTRLWPLSREAYPKQFLALTGERTMIQETVLRAALPSAEHPILVCNQEHRFFVAEQMKKIACTPHAIILEPIGRNTAPASAVAALSVAVVDPAGIVLLLPSDHVIVDQNAFARSVAIAVEAAVSGRIVTFGMKPTAPETGYGYICAGAALDGVAGAFSVEQFVEKPELKTAENYLKDGRYSWNSGMFLFRADCFLRELERLAPEILSGARSALEKAVTDLDFVRLDSDSFAAMPNLSIDYAVMEKTDKAAVVPCEIGWSDVGSWSAIWDIGEHDASGNVLQGDVMTFDVANSFVHSDGRLTALVGVKDLAVIVTDDAVMISDRNRTQDIKKIVERLKADHRSEYAIHNTVYRPWGNYTSIDTGERFQVKEIIVNPGGRLSLQMHHHRAEHWVVVVGTARVTRGDDIFDLHENESTFIPIGVRHRLENLGKIPLHMIEVQVGSYLGEDDIVRMEDNYGRI